MTSSMPVVIGSRWVKIGPLRDKFVTVRDIDKIQEDKIIVYGFHGSDSSYSMKLPEFLEKFKPVPT